VAVLPDESVSPVRGHSWDGVQPPVGEQSPDEPRLEHEAQSRVEPLGLDEACSPGGVPLPEARPADEVHSPDAKRSLLEVRFQDEAYSPEAAYSPSPKRPVDEARHCAVLACYPPQCPVEECCSLELEPASWLLAQLPHF
jgi:hypothetical protein